MMKLAECVMNGVKETIVMKMTYYSLTFDIWSSRVMQSFMAVTVEEYQDLTNFHYEECL